MAKVGKAEDVGSSIVKVKLKCVYSGFPGSPGPGDTIEIDAKEAHRLVSLNAAEVVAE